VYDDALCDGGSDGLGVAETVAGRLSVGHDDDLGVGSFAGQRLTFRRGFASSAADRLAALTTSLNARGDRIPHACGTVPVGKRNHVGGALS
jgi:hypothetical protein